MEAFSCSGQVDEIAILIQGLDDDKRRQWLRGDDDVVFADIQSHAENGAILRARHGRPALPASRPDSAR